MEPIQLIQSVWAPPISEGEEPEGAAVGYSEVTRIERREENLGTYGIVWYDVFKGEVRVKSINALCVQAVYYIV